MTKFGVGAMPDQAPATYISGRPLQQKRNTNRTKCLKEAGRRGMKGVLRGGRGRGYRQISKSKDSRKQLRRWNESTITTAQSKTRRPHDATRLRRSLERLGIRGWGYTPLTMNSMVSPTAAVTESGE